MCAMSCVCTCVQCCMQLAVCGSLLLELSPYIVAAHNGPCRDELAIIYYQSISTKRSNYYYCGQLPNLTYTSCYQLLASYTQAIPCYSMLHAKKVFLCVIYIRLQLKSLQMTNRYIICRMSITFTLQRIHTMVCVCVCHYMRNNVVHKMYTGSRGVHNN